MFYKPVMQWHSYALLKAWRIIKICLLSCLIKHIKVIRPKKKHIKVKKQKMHQTSVRIGVKYTYCQSIEVEAASQHISIMHMNTGYANNLLPIDHSQIYD